MKYLIIFLITFLLITSISPSITYAIYDPTTRPNNKIGIHILFPTELSKAKDLVNSSGGEWGYVTIPIQAGDKDIKKWQSFMDEAKNLKLIPIIRLATEGDYFHKESWKKPTYDDILDFANFLDSLNWPVKNRYIIAFNEVNRSDEWAGLANPEEYAQILSFTVDTFKSKNEDYFVISSGMDNASITRNGTYSQYDFFRMMNESVPGIFDKIDGYSSHSYPNPAFSVPPDVVTKTSISSFIFEKQLINTMSNKDLPIFITETGWDQKEVTEKKSAEYFNEAITSTWKDNKIIAITPFLLYSGPGPFEKFSFIKNDGSKSEVFKTIEKLSKTKGNPIINQSTKKLDSKTLTDLPVKDFSETNENEEGKEVKYFVKWLLLPL